MKISIVLYLPVLFVLILNSCKNDVFISGRVICKYSNTPIDGLGIGLYEKNADLNELPVQYIETNSSGIFHFVIESDLDKLYCLKPFRNEKFDTLSISWNYILENNFAKYNILDNKYFLEDINWGAGNDLFLIPSGGISFILEGDNDVDNVIVATAGYELYLSPITNDDPPIIWLTPSMVHKFEIYESIRGERKLLDERAIYIKNSYQLLNDSIILNPMIYRLKI